MAITRSTNAISALYGRAQSHMPASIIIPKTWLDSYEDFVKNNTSQVSQIESALRSLTYILPGIYLIQDYTVDNPLMTYQVDSMNLNSLLNLVSPAPFPFLDLCFTNHRTIQFIRRSIYYPLTTLRFCHHHLILSPTPATQAIKDRSPKLTPALRPCFERYNTLNCYARCSSSAAAATKNAGGS